MRLLKAPLLSFVITPAPFAYFGNLQPLSLPVFAMLISTTTGSVRRSSEAT
jgi:hypothetical protein